MPGETDLRFAATHEIRKGDLTVAPAGNRLSEAAGSRAAPRLPAPGRWKLQGSGNLKAPNAMSLRGRYDTRDVMTVLTHGPYSSVSMGDPIGLEPP